MKSILHLYKKVECKHVKKTLDISPYTCMHLCAHTHTPLLKMGNTVSEMKNSLGREMIY